MKRIVLLIGAILLLSTGAVLAHHPAEGIVDEEVYAMIDEMVADTPHAEMTTDDLGAGMTETTIETRTTVPMERLLDEGLLTYLNMLDGEVQVIIDFNPDRSLTMTITQQD